MPNQAESGNSTPAGSKGEAQPITQIGGTAESATPMAAVHGPRGSSRVQQKNQGTDRSTAAAIHMKTALASLDGRLYALATSITGNAAAAYVGKSGSSGRERVGWTAMRHGTAMLNGVTHSCPRHADQSDATCGQDTKPD